MAQATDKEVASYYSVLIPVLKSMLVGVRVVRPFTETSSDGGSVCAEFLKTSLYSKVTVTMMITGGLLVKMGGRPGGGKQYHYG